MCRQGWQGRERGVVGCGGGGGSGGSMVLQVLRGGTERGGRRGGWKH